MLKSLFFIFFSISMAQIQPLPDSAYLGDLYPPMPPEDIEVEFILGKEKMNRFGEKTSEFFPATELRKVQILKITGVESPIELRRVRIIYMNGDEDGDAFNLIGELYPGSLRQILLVGNGLYRVEITAAPKFFWQSPGSYILRGVSRK